MQCHLTLSSDLIQHPLLVSIKSFSLIPRAVPNIFQVGPIENQNVDNVCEFYSVLPEI